MHVQLKQDFRWVVKIRTLSRQVPLKAPLLLFGGGVILNVCLCP